MESSEEMGASALRPPHLRKVEDLRLDRRDRFASITRRLLDISIAGVALVALSPVMVIIALAIRMSSPGPVLFRQIRIGYRHRPFRMLKFRTMLDGNDDSEHRAYVTLLLTGEGAPDGDSGLYKLTNDRRVTRVGAFLRRTSLDEVPQLLNVLRGDMSLVGPRPALPWEAEQFKPEHLVRFAVKPGITGLWQVTGRNELSMLQGLELDMEYVRRRTLAFDLTILLMTIPQVLRCRGAR